MSCRGGCGEEIESRDGERKESDEIINQRKEGRRSVGCRVVSGEISALVID